MWTVADPWGIVLVPTEAGEALLATTRIGDLSVPAARVYWDDDYRSWTEHWPGERCGVEALPLWWDGALVPEGLDRLHRVMAHEHWSRTPSAAGALQMARQAAHEGLCRVVVLDLVDGRIVERGQ